MILYLLRVKKENRNPKNSDGIIGLAYAKNVTMIIEDYDNMFADPSRLEVFRLGTIRDTLLFLLDQSLLRLLLRLAKLFLFLQ